MFILDTKRNQFLPDNASFRKIAEYHPEFILNVPEAEKAAMEANPSLIQEFILRGTCLGAAAPVAGAGMLSQSGASVVVEAPAEAPAEAQEAVAVEEQSPVAETVAEPSERKPTRAQILAEKRAKRAD